MDYDRQKLEEVQEKFENLKNEMIELEEKEFDKTITAKETFILKKWREDLAELKERRTYWENLIKDSTAREANKRTRLD
ncbi:hypothetical protein HDU91_001761, partial [Kappamyces sp. JEL0680]